MSPKLRLHNGPTTHRLRLSARPLVDTLPTRCQQLKKGYGECKRGMIDMRKRFRGNKPIASSLENEAGADDESRQLYAGKSAFGNVKSTSGKEAPPTGDNDE